MKRDLQKKLYYQSKKKFLEVGLPSSGHNKLNVKPEPKMVLLLKELNS